MLMDAILIKGLFVKAEAQEKRDSSCTIASSRFQITNVPICDEPTWSRKGEWLPSQNVKKMRLILTGHSRAFIALQDSTQKSLFGRIKDHFTHVNVYAKHSDGSKESFSLNLGSLSKRTQLSVACILFLRVTGKLTLDYLEKSVRKAQEQTQRFDQIIQNGRQRAMQRGEDPNSKAEELKKFLFTVMKSRRLVRGIVAQVGKSTYIAHQGKNKRIILVEKRELLGEGTFGIVHEVINYTTGECQALKIAKKTNHKSGINNENLILNEIHQHGHVKGIQHPPHFVLDLSHPECGVAYVAKEYDFNLSDEHFLKLTPLSIKLKECRDLFNGLSFLHQNKLVHSDIKPANCCSDDGELQIADFGHARRHENIMLQHPLGVCSPVFTSARDKLENQRIALCYRLHMIANDEIKNPFSQAIILQSAIQHPSFNIDRQAAKLTIASLLITLNQNQKPLLRKLNAEEKEQVEVLTKFYHDEIEILNNSRILQHSQIDFSIFLLDTTEIEQLKKEAINLCRCHDVYGLGLTLLCIFTGKRYILQSEIQIALNQLARSPELIGINAVLIQLLKTMVDPDPTKRPLIEDAAKKYHRILRNKLGVS